jgi:hypothetical protein
MTQDEVKKIVGMDEWSEMISKVSIMADRLKRK